MQIIKLPRRGGKTTKALEILRDNEKSVMFQHVALRSDHPILDENPELKRRIFSTCDFRERLRGMIVDTVIIENVDLLEKHAILDMLHHFTTFPLSNVGFCNIVLTMTEEEIKPKKHDCRLRSMEVSEDDDGYFFLKDQCNVPFGREHFSRVEYCPVCGMKSKSSHLFNMTMYQRDPEEEIKADEMNDKINHPSHYQGNGLEAIDVIEAFELDFNLGNAVKYILRAGKKDCKKQDLEKASWYISRSICNEEENKDG